MKRLNLVALSIISLLVLLSNIAFADAIEPIDRLNISPVQGTAGSGIIRALVSFDRYEYTISNTKDASDLRLQAEMSIKIIEQVGVGLRVPYHVIDNENVLFGNPNGIKKDENGIGNIVFGAHVQLPPPSKTFDLVIGANAKFPTADRNVGKELSSIEPYAILLAKDGDLSFTLSCGYEMVMDEQDRTGKRDNMYDNMLTLNASALFSARKTLSVGAQLLVKSADEALIEFIPQVRIHSDAVEWGVALTVPINSDYPHGGEIEKSYGIIADAGFKF